MKQAKRLLTALLLATALLALGAGTALAFDAGNAGDFIDALSRGEAINITGDIELNRGALDTAGITTGEVETDQPITITNGFTLTINGVTLRTKADFTVLDGGTLNICGDDEYIEAEGWVEEYFGALIVENWTDFDPDKQVTMTVETDGSVNIGLDENSVINGQDGNPLNVGIDGSSLNEWASLNINGNAEYVGLKPNRWGDAQFNRYTKNGAIPDAGDLDYSGYSTLVDNMDGLRAAIDASYEDDNRFFGEIILVSDIEAGTFAWNISKGEEYTLRDGQMMFISCDATMAADVSLRIDGDALLFVHENYSFTQKGDVNLDGKLILEGAYTLTRDVEATEKAYLYNYGHILLNNGAHVNVDTGAELINANWEGRAGRLELNGEGSTLTVAAGGALENGHDCELILNGTNAQLNVEAGALFGNWSRLCFYDEAEGIALNINGYMYSNGGAELLLYNHNAQINVDRDPEASGSFEFIFDDNGTPYTDTLKNGTLLNRGYFDLNGTLNLTGDLLNERDIELNGTLNANAGCLLENWGYINLHGDLNLSGRLDNYNKLENHGNFTVSGETPSINNYTNAQLMVGDSETFGSWHEFNDINFGAFESAAVIHEQPSLRLGNIEYNEDDSVQRYNLEGEFYLTKGERLDDLHLYLGCDYGGDWVELTGEQKEYLELTVNMATTYTNGHEYSYDANAGTWGEDWDTIDVGRVDPREDGSYSIEAIDWGHSAVCITVGTAANINDIPLAANDVFYNNFHSQLPYGYFFYDCFYNQDNALWGGAYSYMPEQSIWFMCENGFDMSQIDYDAELFIDFHDDSMEDIQWRSLEDNQENQAAREIIDTYLSLTAEECGQDDEGNPRYAVRIDFNEAAKKDFNLYCRVGGTDRWLECCKPRVFIEDVAARAGEVVTVKVRADYLPDFAGFNLQLGYDAEYLTYIDDPEDTNDGVQWNPALVDTAHITEVNPVKDGQLNLTYIYNGDADNQSSGELNDDAVAGELSGCLFSVTFTVNNNPENHDDDDYSANAGLTLNFTPDPKLGENNQGFTQNINNEYQASISPRLDGGQVEIYRWGDVYRKTGSLGWVTIQDAVRLNQLVNKCGSDFEDAQGRYGFSCGEYEAANINNPSTSNVNNDDLITMVNYLVGRVDTLPFVQDK